ncbi:MAG: hypothetical protein ABID38_03775, partial [Candidatus Diapherotrites archaeon]
GPDPDKKLFNFWRIKIGESLTDRIENECEPEVCINAMNRMNNLIKKKIFPRASPILNAFEKALDHIEPEVRTSAVGLCYKIAPDRFRPILSEMSEHESNKMVFDEICRVIPDDIIKPNHFF